MSETVELPGPSHFRERPVSSESKLYLKNAPKKVQDRLDQKQYILDNYQTGSLLVVHMYCLTLVTFFF